MTNPDNAAEGRPSFEALFHEHSDAVFRFLYYRSYGDAGLAREMTQETFFQAFKNFDTLDWREPFSLLCGIGIRVLSKHRRTQARQTKRLQAWRELKTASNDFTAAPAGHADADDRALLVGETLALLPPNYRDALLRKYRAGQSQAEMASDLNLSEKAVESMLVRARKKFIEVMRSLHE